MLECIKHRRLACFVSSNGVCGARSARYLACADSRDPVKLYRSNLALLRFVKYLSRHKPLVPRYLFHGVLDKPHLPQSFRVAESNSKGWTFGAAFGQLIILRQTACLLGR